MKERWILLSIVSLFLLAAFVFATTEQRSPTKCGYWTNCEGAFANGGSYAYANVSNGTNVTGDLGNYGFDIPANMSNVTNVTLRVDAFGSGGQMRLDVKASNDGGSNFGNSHIIFLAASESIFTIDLNNDFVWTREGINNGAFVTRVKCYRQTSGSGSCGLDWIPLTVTYV